MYEKEQGNPYEGHGGEVEASWWPKGTPRKVASGYLNEFLVMRAKLMGRPHACEFSLSSSLWAAGMTPHRHRYYHPINRLFIWDERSG